MYDFNGEYKRLQTKFENYLNRYVEELKTTPSILGESMAYSLTLGGKRVRPVLLLATAELLSVADEDALPFALALEMVHTYSLIHDDLPAMDNDDYRRGKPSNHKVFGEGNAVLAGDALLNTAYQICLKECLKGRKQVSAASLLCECAGIDGMIAGQSADLYYQEFSAEQSEENLEYIYENKTGKLLQAPTGIASILADSKYYLQLSEYAKMLGLLFQITDDILDVEGDFFQLGKTIGKDAQENKFTSIRYYTLEGAKIHAEVYAEKCCTLLESIDADTSFLKNLVFYVKNRKN